MIRPLIDCLKMGWSQPFKKHSHKRIRQRKETRIVQGKKATPVLRQMLKKQKPNTHFTFQLLCEMIRQGQNRIYKEGET